MVAVVKIGDINMPYKFQPRRPMLCIISRYSEINTVSVSKSKIYDTTQGDMPYAHPLFYDVKQQYVFLDQKIKSNVMNNSKSFWSAVL